MADTSLIIGNGNWAVKENSLLGYNIIQGKYVPIEMTVSRNSTGTRKNSGGLIELGPKNLFSQSQTFESWYNTLQNSTVIPNVLATSAPNDTFTADKLVAAVTAINATHLILQQPAGSVNGITVTASVFAKASEFSRIRLVNNAGTAFADYILSGLGGSTPSGGASANIENYGNGWYRCIMTYTPTNTGTFNIQIRLVDNSNTDLFTGDGTSGVFLWGAQLETGTTATAYFPTTDRFNIPRIDYSTGTTGSLLVEQQRTNLVPNGLGYNPVAGILYDITITDSPAIDINSARITKSVAAGGGDIYAQQINSTAVLLGSTTYTLSRYFKYDGHTITTSMQFNNNAPWGGTGWNQEIFIASTGVTLGTSINCTSTVQNAGNSWYRVNVTILTGATPAGSPQDLMILKSSLSTGQGFLTALPQLEVGSNATSYIPTTISTPTAGVTRDADVITKTGVSSLIGQTEGTIFWDVKDLTVSTSTGNPDFGIRNTLGHWIAITTNTAAAPFRITVNSAAGLLINYSENITTAKACVKYGTFGVKLFLNGNPTAVATSPTNPNFSSLDLIDIKGGNMSYKANSFMVWKTALTDQECIDLTT